MTATSSNSTKVTSDYWVEFVRIYDSNGDGVLQLDEFINFCRFQVAAVFFSNGVKAKGILVVVGGCRECTTTTTTTSDYS